MQHPLFFRNASFALLLFMLGAGSIHAQPVSGGKDRHLLFSVFNTGTKLPGSLFSLPVHPGATVGMEFRYNMHPKNQWFQTAKLGFSYHRYAQTTVQLYSEGGYRRLIWKGFGAEFRLGAGYLHAFPATEIFKLENGVYKKKSNWGRPQFMGGAALGLNYQLPPSYLVRRLFLDYQFFLQMPFIKSYVPLLPNTLLHAGVAFSFPNFK